MPTETRRKTPSRKPPADRADAQPNFHSQTDPAVAAFLRELDHPLKPELESVRQLILGASPAIREGIKWNAPSFRTSEYFATFNLRAKDRLRLILHFGAKVKDGASAPEVPDPDGLLERLAPDRCLVTLRDADDVRDKAEALQTIVRAWIAHLPCPPANR